MKKEQKVVERYQPHQRYYAKLYLYEGISRDTIPKCRFQLPWQRDHSTVHAHRYMVHFLGIPLLVALLLKQIACLRLEG